MSSKGFYFDSRRCTGCKTCQVACKDLHDHPVGINFRRVYEYTGGEWAQDSNEAWNADVFSYCLSIACNHCEDPACTKVCPSGAMHKDDNGVVKVDSNMCIGCKSCMKACPYGAPQFDPVALKAVKCDACEERVNEGKKPVCVEACPYRALDYGDMDVLHEKYGESVTVAPLPNASLTKPNLIVKPSRLARPEGDATGFIANPKEV